ncbi:MAG: hypothetical protein J0H11_15045 [Rhizobiales bacterium]|nr:hypothetical protein [Hyphomicrobiales bacterium]
MARVRFLADFDYSPAALRGMVTVAYKAGAEETVTRDCAAAAVKAGKAERLPALKKAKADDGRR